MKRAVNEEALKQFKKITNKLEDLSSEIENCLEYINPHLGWSLDIFSRNDRRKEKGNDWHDHNNCVEEECEYCDEWKEGASAYLHVYFWDGHHDIVIEITMKNVKWLFHSFCFRREQGYMYYPISERNG